MAYEPPTRLAFFKFAVRNSYREALLLSLIVFVLILLVPLILFGRIAISAIEAAAVFLGFYLLSLSSLVLHWYAEVAKSRRESRKKGW